MGYKISAIQQKMLPCDSIVYLLTVRFTSLPYTFLCRNTKCTCLPVARLCLYPML